MEEKSRFVHSSDTSIRPQRNTKRGWRRRKTPSRRSREGEPSVVQCAFSIEEEGMTTYLPRPIDTSQVALDERQRQLVEKLAANAHDVWAQKRLADGWRLGPERNDRAKTH